MFMISGDWFTSGVQSVDTESFLDSVIISNTSVLRRIRVPTYEIYKAHWSNDPEIQKNYWAANFLLPIGTIFVLVLVILLMVLFTRCPQMVAAIILTILVVITLFAAFIIINQTPIYT